MDEKRPAGKTKTSLYGPGHLNSRQLGNWVPKTGEKIGFMVSTFVRGSERTINERSNISWIEWQ